MAPLSKSLPSLFSRTNNILTTTSSTTLTSTTDNATAPTTLHARAAASTYTPCSGCMDPRNVNNKLYFALFALIGAALVVSSIWFFFWARNGGFHWQQGDWDDYKSTVMRRKGPDGKTIYSSRSTIMPPPTHDRLAAKSVVGWDEKGRKGVMAVRGFGGSHSVHYPDEFTSYGGSVAGDMQEVKSHKGGHRSNFHGSYTDAGSNDHSRRYRDRDLRDYKHEKPARVGGMNRSADGTTYTPSDCRSDTLTDGSTAPLTSSHDRKRAKAERRAAEDASRMERKWRKEASRAAAALAKENATPATAASSHHRTTSSNAAKRSSRHTSRTRSRSPKKQATRSSRQYSFSGAPDETSTVYTGTYTNTSSNRTGSSYYEAYRPLAQTSPQHDRSSRHSSASPSKQDRRSRHRGGGRDVMAGYRRGMDSLGSDSE